MVNQSKGRFGSFLLTLFVVAGSVLGFVQVFGTSAIRNAHASTGWQLQELWHTNVATDSQLGLIGSNCDGLGSPSDLTYASGTIFETFLYHGICTAQPPNETDGFDAATGAPVWNQNQLIGGSGSGWQAPLVSNGTLVVPNAYAWTGSTWLEAFDATNDQTPELWTAGGTDVAVDNGVAYAQLGRNINSGPEGSIYSYDLPSGQVKWQNTDNVCDSFGSPSPKIEIYNGVVYYIGCQNTDGTYAIQARSITDGSPLWSKNVSSSFSTWGLPGLVPSSNSTLISNGSIFVVTSTTDGSNNPTISSFTTSDGTQNWSKTLSDTPSAGCLSNNCTFIGQIIASGSVVYVLEDIAYNHDSQFLPSADIYALDSASGNELWHKSISINGYLYNGNYGGNTAFHGTLVGGVLYFNFSTAIFAFDAATGNQLMMDDTVATGNGKYPISTPLVVGNVMYLTGTDSGSIGYVLHAYQITGQQPSGTWVSPSDGFSVQAGTTLQLSANASPAQANSSIQHVDFAVNWSGTWHTICTTTSSSNTFGCNWNLEANGSPVPIGAIQLQFTVYDSSGTTFLSPTLQGTITPQPVTVQKVWTADGNNNSQTSFTPGDAIKYEVQMNNTTGTTVTASFTFLATGPQQIFSWSGPQSVASGTPIITLASTVPTNAPAGTYTLTVTVSYNGVNSSGQNTFIVVLLAASSNWAGYLSEGKTYSEVESSWQVPKANCSKGETSLSGFWVGLDGFNNLAIGVGWLEQIGTASACTKGQPYYYAFWEIREPGVIPSLNTIGHSVQPGDSMQAQVQFVGLDALNRPQFLFTIHDSTQQWGFSTQQGDVLVGASRNSAECIAEDPAFFSLTNFGQVNFSGCKADGKPINQGPTTVKVLLTNNGQLNGKPLTVIGSLVNGTDFSVTWKRKN